ncbi:hypothetical protein HGM15179_018140, partial [Zosterops borbonicus]
MWGYPWVPLVSRSHSWEEETALGCPVPPSGFSRSFTTIKQGVKESFTKFVDILKAALEKQLESADARREMLVKMAPLNANLATKPILRALPLDPEPTIAQMIEACMKHNSMENTVAQVVAQGITQGTSAAFAIIASDDTQRCFNWGQFGHFIADCPEKEAVEDHHRDHQWLRSNPNRSYVRGIDRDLQTTSDCSRSNQVATSHQFCVAHAIEQRKTDSAGHTASGLLCNLLPMPTYPVIPPPKVSDLQFPNSCAAQNGASDVASPAILPPSFPSFPTFNPQNGHYLVTSSQVVGVSGPLPNPHPIAPIGVTAMGPSPCDAVGPTPGYALRDSPTPDHAPQTEATPMAQPPAPDTGSANDADQKEAILASTTNKAKRSPKRRLCKKNIKLSIPSSEDDSSDSSLTDIEYEDHWAKTREEAIRDIDWESANKITAFPIM